MSNMRKDAYAVEVIGFNQTERIVLSSIFGLSARRQPKFVQHSTVAFSPDLFLVDASDAQALALFNERNNLRRVPAILIGDSDHGTGYPLLARPLQWTRLFKAFDSAITEDNAQQSQFERTMPNIIPPSSLAPAGVPPVVTAAPTVAPAFAPAAKSAPAPAYSAPQPRMPFAASTPTPAAKTVDLSLEVTQVMQPVPAAYATPPAPAIHLAPPAPSNFQATPVPSIVPAVRTQPLAPPPIPAAPITSFAPSAPHAALLTPAAPPVVVAPPPVETKPEADWVLVVDDNTTVREFMKSKLAPFNFNVDYAESGEQAVGLTGQRRYTCVFLDVVMPGIDGYQVCKLIKSKKSLGKTAVVMLTSKSSPFDKIRGAMAGCDAYLTKPVDEEKLLETIVRFLPARV
jgi:CheY-like chemotaxis protein